MSGEAGLRSPGVQPWTVPEKPREGDGTSPRVGASLACSQARRTCGKPGQEQAFPTPHAPAALLVL